MTVAAQSPLEKLKAFLNIESSAEDTLLSLILEDAEVDFLEITHREEVPLQAEGLIIRMAVVKYNMIGCEGLKSQSQSGLSETFGGYDNDLLKRIHNYRKVKFL